MAFAVSFDSCMVAPFLEPIGSLLACYEHCFSGWSAKRIRPCHGDLLATMVIGLLNTISLIYAMRLVNMRNLSFS